jgi:hypothetical protein
MEHRLLKAKLLVVLVRLEASGIVMPITAAVLVQEVITIPILGQCQLLIAKLASRAITH